MNKLAQAYKIGSRLALSKHLPKLSRKQKALVGGGALGALGLKAALAPRTIVLDHMKVIKHPLSDLDRLIASNKTIIGKGVGLPSPAMMPRRTDSLEFLFPKYPGFPHIKKPLASIEAKLLELASNSKYPRDSIADALYRVRDADDLVRATGLNKFYNFGQEVPKKLFHRAIEASSAARREAQDLVLSTIPGPKDIITHNPGFYNIWN